MARFVEIFKDWIVSYPNRYKLTENGQEKTVEIERDWEPDVEGTSNNEIVMNELVKNITYDTDTVHTTESGTSVYTCDLVGMKEFIEYSSSDSSFIPKISAQINAANSNQLSKIRFSGKDGSVIDYDLYTINNGVYSLLGANKLKANIIVVIKIVSNGANKIAVVQYLMDDKYDKTGGVIKGYPVVQIPGFSQYGMGTFSGIYENGNPSWIVGRNSQDIKTILRNYATSDNSKFSEIVLRASAGNNILTGKTEDGVEMTFYNSLNFYPVNSVESTAVNLPASAASVKTTFDFLKGNTGIASTVLYIQDDRIKYPGFIYLDRSVTPNTPYRCLVANNDTTPTSNFMPANNNDLARVLNTIITEVSQTVTSSAGNFTLIFTKVGKIVQVYITTTGGSINGTLTNKTLPESFRPSINVFLGFPAISGSPYVSISTSGTLGSYDNGATLHTTTTTTQYSLTQTYIAANY